MFSHLASAFAAAVLIVTMAARGGLAHEGHDHDSQRPHGSTVGPRSQFRQAARIFAIEVLPVPREPTNR